MWYLCEEKKSPIVTKEDIQKKYSKKWNGLRTRRRLENVTKIEWSLSVHTTTYFTNTLWQMAINWVKSEHFACWRWSRSGRVQTNYCRDFPWISWKPRHTLESVENPGTQVENTVEHRAAWWPPCRSACTSLDWSLFDRRFYKICFF